VFQHQAAHHDHQHREERQQPLSIHQLAKAGACKGADDAAEGEDGAAAPFHVSKP
jgi:hypothetical protein